MPEGASEGVKKSGRYKADIESLLKRGELLSLALQFTCYPEEAKRFKAELLAKLPSFSSDYQAWYSECVSCLSQLLPQRLEDFRGYYDLGKPRKEITAANYCIRDALLGLQVTSGQEPWKQVVVDAKSAMPLLSQQIAIVKSLLSRFESSLFDVRTLLQADLFDSELEAAEELNTKGFTRGAGAIAGVVLEGHLREIATNRKVTVAKNATLGALLAALKAADILDVPSYRSLQYLADLRNLCDHKLKDDPTKEQVGELIAGVAKAIKTLF